MLRGDLLNPDTFMRLVRLQDTLRAGAPVHVVLRDGGGTLLHWSHFLDSLLLLIALPLHVFLPWPAALHGAAVAFGPLSAGCLGIAVAWVLAPLSLPGWRWTAPALAAMAPPIVYYAFPGVVHHHVPLGLAAAMLAGCAGRIAAGARNESVRLGAWAAAGLWLSPEATPIIALAFGGVGLAWLRGRAAGLGAAISVAGGVFFVLSAAAWLVDPPVGGWWDASLWRLSVVFVALALVVALFGLALLAIDRSQLAPRPRALAAAVTGAALLAIWIALFPAVLQGDAAGPDGGALAAMFADIEEMKPVRSIAQALTMLLGGVLALLVLAWLAATRRSLLWAYAACAVGATLALGAMHIRFATYGAVAAAACLPVAVSEVTTRLAGSALLPLARVALLAVAMLATRADALLAKPQTAEAASPCTLREAAALLAPFGDAVVLSDVNDVPELLYRTRVRTVGSLYLNVAGFERLRAAWRSPPGAEEPGSVRATGATLVLFCRRAGRSLLVADLAPDTLLDRLGRGEVPAWLEPAAAGGGYVLYKIKL